MNKAVLSSFIEYFEFVAFEGWVEGRYRYGLGAMALSGQKVQEPQVCGDDFILLWMK